MDESLAGAELQVVDARGHRCPTPTLRLLRALQAARAGEVVALLADDPMARIDVAHFTGQAGHLLLEVTAEGRGWRFTVRKAAAPAAADRAAPPA